MYYDGQHNDSRMNLHIALTAAQHGATIGNHIEVLDLVKKDGAVAGAKVRDCESGEVFEISSKVVINATGPFADAIRKMDDPQAPEMIVPAAVGGLRLGRGQREGRGFTSSCRTTFPRRTWA